MSKATLPADIFCPLPSAQMTPSESDFLWLSQAALEWGIVLVVTVTALCSWRLGFSETEQHPGPSFSLSVLENVVKPCRFHTNREFTSVP